MMGRTTTVTPDFPLIVSDIENPTEYDEIFFQRGGYIEIKVGAELTIDKITEDDGSLGGKIPTTNLNSSQKKNWNYDIIIVSEDGIDGKKGQKGEDGATSANGKNGRDGCNNFDQVRHGVTFWDIFLQNMEEKRP